MLAKENHLKKNKDFQRVFNNGKSLAGQFTVIYWLANGLSDNRYGFSVSKKVGNAVLRNRIKRILREFLKKNQNIRTGFDIIIIARPKIKGICTALVEKDLMRLLSRAHLIRKQREIGKQ